MVMISPSNIAYSVNSFENIIFVAKEEKSMNFKFETRLVSVEFTVYISSTFDSWTTNMFFFFWLVKNLALRCILCFLKEKVTFSDIQDTLSCPLFHSQMREKFIFIFFSSFLWENVNHMNFIATSSKKKIFSFVTKNTKKNSFAYIFIWSAGINLYHF